MSSGELLEHCSTCRNVLFLFRRVDRSDHPSNEDTRLDASRLEKGGSKQKRLGLIGWCRSPGPSMARGTYRRNRQPRRLGVMRRAAMRSRPFGLGRKPAASAKSAGKSLLSRSASDNACRARPRLSDMRRTVDRSKSACVPCIWTSRGRESWLKSRQRRQIAR